MALRAELGSDWMASSGGSEENPDQREAGQFAAADCTPRAHSNAPTITTRGQNGANCRASAHASRGHAAKANRWQ